jgi:Tat protein secretion system quality control protein TatD with DNase activity
LFLDSHCHLDKLKLAPYNGDLAAALAAAAERGVQRFLCIGIGIDNIDRVVDIAEQYPSVYASVGIHPSEFGGSEYHPADPRIVCWNGRGYYPLAAVGEPPQSGSHW